MTEFIWQTFYSSLVILTMGRAPYYTWKNAPTICHPWLEFCQEEEKLILEASDGSKHSHNARLHISLESLTSQDEYIQNHIPWKCSTIH